MSKLSAVPSITVGVDLGDRYSELCVLDAEGEVQEESRIRTQADAFRKKFSAVRSCRVVMEVGSHSRWASQVVRECGHEVVIANARKVRLIVEGEDKDDPVDANLLARLGRFDPKLLKPIQHRSEQVQNDLAVLHARDALVSARTKLVNHVRGVVKAAGGRVARCSADSFARRATEELPEELRSVLTPMVEVIADLTARIHRYEREIEVLGETRYPQTRWLRQIAGVGPITALAFVLILEDPERFRNSRAVGPYLGLCRRRHKSGTSDPQLGITKAGNPFLRRLLLQAGHYVLGPFGPDCDLRRWGMRLAAGGRGAKKRAAIAVARKLAVLMLVLWRKQRTYQPLRAA